MTDAYLLAILRMKELRREAELARRGRGREPGRPPREGGPSVSRLRVVLAQWLMAAAERLWPEVGRNVMGGAR
jgi:hypothetical protein